MKSLRTNLMVYFLVVIILPLTLVVWRFSIAFQDETEKFVARQTSNILKQTEKNILSAVDKARGITEYNNDIFKKKTLPLPLFSKLLEKKLVYYSLRELLKTSVFNSEMVRNVGLVNLQDKYFIMAYRNPQHKLEIKETRLGKLGKPWSRYWKSSKKSDPKSRLPSPWKEDDFVVENRPWFKKALNQSGLPDYQMVWTEPYIFKESGEVGITSAKAVNSSGKGLRKPFAIVFTDLSLLGITETLKRLDLGKGNIFLTNPKGEVLSSSHSFFQKISSSKKLFHITDFKADFFSQKVWNRFLKTNGGVKINDFHSKTSNSSLGKLLKYEYKGEIYLARSLLLKDPTIKKFQWQAWIIVPRKELLVDFQKSLYQTYLLALLSAFGAILISLFLWNKITKDLCQIVEAFEQLKKGNLKVQIMLKKPYEEIKILESSFNEMVSGLWEKKHMEKLVSKGARENIQKQIAQKPEEFYLKKGIHKEVTLFFSDIRGFTAYSESRTPEEVVGMLNKYLDVQAKILEKYHGDIDKFVGDEIMAIFEGENASLNAMKASHEILLAIQKLNQQTAQTPSIHVGIGLHSGPVIAGYMGSEGRADYTVIGDTVNFAARLCSKAGSSEIWFSENIKKLLPESTSYETRSNVEFKGKSKMYTIYLCRGNI